MIPVLISLLFSTLASAAAQPRLYVVVVVDQMRADYLRNSTSTAPYVAGLKRLASEGLVFDQAHHTHATLETGPGHAVILFGRLPDSTGIICHAWYDVDQGKEVYCVDDSLHGKGLENFVGYTLPDALKARLPQSKVVSVSIKDRAAIFMGGRRSDATLWYSRPAGAFVTSTYSARPAWLDRFNESLKKKGGMLAGATTTYQDQIVYTPEADSMLLALALEAAKRFKLGRDDSPDILAVSFSATDYVGHRYGPDSAPMRVQLQRLDRTLGALLDGL